MSEINLKNKLITVSDVLKISDIVVAHRDELAQRAEKAKAENEGNELDAIYDIYIGFQDLKFSVYYGDAREEKDDYEWFKNALTHDASKITGIAINYSCHYQENAKRYAGQLLDEHFRIHLDTNHIGYGTLDKQAPNTESSQKFSREIDEVISNCKPRYDKTLQKRNLYRLVPSFAISFLLGFLVALVVFALAKLSVLPESFASFVADNPYILPIIVVGMGALLGFALPNPSMALFKQIKIDKNYQRYDPNWQIDHYENDYKRFMDQTEFSVGEFYGSDKAREKIKKNFKMSLICMALVIVLSVVLTIVAYVL